MKSKFPITATFIDEISYDMPSSNWTEEQWSADLDYMQEVGIDTVVFIRGGFYGKTLFPCEGFECWRKDDLVGHILREAAKRGMKVFMGLYISDLRWNNGDYEGELEKNKVFMAEFLKRYGDISSFCGWYIPHEQCWGILNLGKTMRVLAEYCKKITPDKLVLISPYFKTLVTEREAFTPEEFYVEWDNLFSQFAQYVDICAFQDGTAPIEELADYFAVSKRFCDKYNVALWANIETFKRDRHHNLPPIPFEILQRKLEIVEPYVENCMTFEFSHFLSPQSIYILARNLNTLYQNYYEKNNK